VKIAIMIWLGLLTLTSFARTNQESADLYKIIDVDRNASVQEIKNQCRKLMTILHKDKAENYDENKFTEAMNGRPFTQRATYFLTRIDVQITTAQDLRSLRNKCTILQSGNLTQHLRRF
jgi:hypothetical protein